MSPYPRLVLAAACLAVFLLLAARGAPGGDGREADGAREAVRTGRFVPLEEIVAWVETRYRGRLIEVELEMEDGDHGGRSTYEVEWITPQGNVIEFEFDAQSGESLEIEGRGLEEARRR